LTHREGIEMTLDGKFERGKIQHIHLWANRSLIGDVEVVKRFLKELVLAIKMTPHGEPSIHEYPTKELGFTATACVAVQHLHESYIVFDNWVEFSPAYANIVINSCKDFDIESAMSVVTLTFKPVSVRVSNPDPYSSDRFAPME
jgi:hypothetical protein